MRASKGAAELEREAIGAARSLLAAAKLVGERIARCEHQAADHLHKLAVTAVELTRAAEHAVSAGRTRTR